MASSAKAIRIDAHNVLTAYLVCAERAVVKRSTAELQRLQGLIDEKEAVIGQALPRMRELAESMGKKDAELEAEKQERLLLEEELKKMRQEAA